MILIAVLLLLLLLETIYNNTDINSVIIYTIDNIVAVPEQ